jgi:hypothetical protein
LISPIAGGGCLPYFDLDDPTPADPCLLQAQPARSFALTARCLGTADDAALAAAQVCVGIAGAVNVTHRLVGVGWAGNGRALTGTQTG